MKLIVYPSFLEVRVEDCEEIDEMIQHECVHVQKVIESSLEIISSHLKHIKDEFEFGFFCLGSQGDTNISLHVCCRSSKRMLCSRSPRCNYDKKMYKTSAYQIWFKVMSKHLILKSFVLLY